MKRFSKKWFTQIMINRLLKIELDQLKNIIAKDTSANWNLSYGDVISYLISDFKKKRKAVYELEPGLLVGTSLNNSNVKVSSSLKQELSLVHKLDSKNRVSFSLES